MLSKLKAFFRNSPQPEMDDREALISRIESLENELAEMHRQADDAHQRMITAGLVEAPRNTVGLDAVFVKHADQDIGEKIWEGRCNAILDRLACVAVLSYPIPSVEAAPEALLWDLPGYPNAPETYKEQYNHVLRKLALPRRRANAFLESLRQGHTGDADRILTAIDDRFRMDLIGLVEALATTNDIPKAAQAYVQTLVSERRAKTLSERASSASSQPVTSATKRSL